MRYLMSTAVVVVAGLMALPALAQPPGPQGPGQRGGRMRDPEIRQQMLEKFDADGDGRLNDEERQAMRESMRGQMRERAGRGGPRPDADRGGRPDVPPVDAAPSDLPGPAADELGPPEEPKPEAAPAAAPQPERRHARGRADGPPGPAGGKHRRGPQLAPLFDWFDGNGNGQLSREEFLALAKFVGSHRPGPPADRPRVGRQGMDGAPMGPGMGRRGGEGRRGPAAGPREGAGQGKGVGPRDGAGPRPGAGLRDGTGPREGSGPREGVGPRRGAGPREGAGPRQGAGRRGPQGGPPREAGPPEAVEEPAPEEAPF